MKPVFQFRDGCHLRGNAQEVGERLESIKSKSKTLTPALVLSDARNIRSPLHGYFEWDDTAASEKYRLDQAGHLVRSVVVTFEEVDVAPVRQIQLESIPAMPTAEPRPVRAFLPITSQAGERSYVSTQDAMGDPDMRKQVLQRAHAEMTALGKKYRELQELSGVFDALEKVGMQLREPTAA